MNKILRDKVALYIDSVNYGGYGNGQANEVLQDLEDSLMEPGNGSRQSLVDMVDDVYMDVYDDYTPHRVTNAVNALKSWINRNIPAAAFGKKKRSSKKRKSAKKSAKKSPRRHRK